VVAQQTVKSPLHRRLVLEVETVEDALPQLAQHAGGVQGWKGGPQGRRQPLQQHEILPGAGGQATIRLGAHVTWLRLDGAQPGQALPGGMARKRVFDELARWLSAYLSGQIRDQLL